MLGKEIYASAHKHIYIGTALVANSMALQINSEINSESFFNMASSNHLHQKTKTNQMQVTSLKCWHHDQ